MNQKSCNTLQPVAGADSSLPSVLVVVDDAIMRLRFRIWLEAADWLVEEACGGQKVIEAFQRLRPDLVILELMMPEMDGFKTCASLRNLEEGRHTPILAITGIQDNASINRAFNAGATDFISKPVSSELLKHRARYLLRSGRALEDLARSEANLSLLKAAVESLPIGITISDAKGKIIYTNPSEAAMHGYEVGELLHREAQVLAPQRLHRTSSLRNPEKCELWRRESVNRRKDGEEFRVHLSSISVRNPQGEFLGMVTACEDITERKKNEARIQTLAYFDSLTGLPNRSLFLNRLQKALSQAERSKQTVAVLFLDLDNFKNINDTEGHGFGDRLLKEVARRLTGCIRAADTLARLGGDEFVVLLASSEKKMASSTALRIMESFRPPFEIEGRLTYASFSIGIALYPDDASNMKDLLRSADTAMYKAKAGGRQNFQFFSPQMNKEVVEKVAMESALRQALDREELTLCCQPHWDLQTGSRYVVEVSARWLHPELGEISPKHFLPLAESSGLIFRLGEWVLRSACNQAKVWTDVGCPVERVAVSISGHQLRQAGFANFIERILVETKLDPNFLELELTESVLINQGEQILPVLQALKRMGIHLSIDDFGIGYSSLSYLKNFPVDRIKIDRSFVAGIDGDPGNAAIVAAIIALARILKIGVLAKGVETLAQLEFLQQHGCSESLGFLLEDPMTEADLVRWLNHPPVPLSVTSGISSRT
jgi:diguanylate cyclase (GGDEF)-like protein/PAS domain S-box-containing protein